MAAPARRRNVVDFALIWGSWATVFLALGEVAWWLITPSYSARPKGQWIIIENLRVIAAQKQTWAADHQKHISDTPTSDDLSPYFQNGKFPPAVIGETYNINPVGEQPTATTPSRLKMAKMTIEAGSSSTIPDK